MYDDERRTTFPISINLRSNNGLYSVPFCYVNIFFGNNQQNYSDFYEKTLIKIGYDKSEAKRLIQLALEFEKKYNEQPLKDNNVTSLLIASNSYKNLPLKELVENWNIWGLVQYGFANPSHFEVFNSMYVEENLEIIKNLCILKLISSFANCLDKDFEQIQIDFNSEK